tara:strand:+ start:479 stop:751 length:273 start_codon:yes stop_codon:yes gene_type:complete
MLNKHKQNTIIELEEIKQFSKLDKYTQKLTTLLKFNDYEPEIISTIIQKLQQKYSNINVFKAYKLDYPEEYKTNIIQIKYYTNTSYSSMI